jgi:predicted oxidoreductase
MIGAHVIAIGSGFGGAVLSCRLSEAGCRVLVLAPFCRPPHGLALIMGL